MKQTNKNKVKEKTIKQMNINSVWICGQGFKYVTRMKWKWILINADFMNDSCVFDWQKSLKHTSEVTWHSIILPTREHFTPSDLHNHCSHRNRSMILIYSPQTLWWAGIIRALVFMGKVWWCECHSQTLWQTFLYRSINLHYSP